MSFASMLDILDRAHHGPVCSLTDWDSKIIPKNCRTITKNHGLEKTFDRENPINTDDKLADEFFSAGFELAVETGLLCVDTERVVKVTEEELHEALRKAPRNLSVGDGFDARTLESRKPEDGKRPLFCSPLGIAVSEDIWITLMQGIAQLREVDILQGGSLPTVFGREIRSGTPYETFAGRLNAQMHREALWRAGRLGMGATAVISSVTLLAQVGGYGIPGGFDSKKDLALVLSPVELKTTYVSLNKIVHALNCGGKIIAGAPSFIGGYAGGPEQTVVACVATNLLQIAVHQSSIAYGSPFDVRYNTKSSREGLWAAMMAAQALSRSGHLIAANAYDQLAGPCTDMLLYESAVGMMGISSSGISMNIGPRSANGRLTDYLTPLECKFNGEVLKACGGMKRTDANEIAKQIVPKYEPMLATPPKGKSFRECYDVRTLQPSQEWLDIYHRVRLEMVDLGIPLPS